MSGYYIIGSRDLGQCRNLGTWPAGFLI